MVGITHGLSSFWLTRKPACHKDVENLSQIKIYYPASGFISEEVLLSVSVPLQTMACALHFPHLMKQQTCVLGVELERQKRPEGRR